MAGFIPIVNGMTITSTTVQKFFDRYRAALLARDAEAIAAMYAVPSLILFPGRSVPVTDARQTEEFFASSWAQYDGVDTVDKSLSVMGTGPATVWVDVTWSYGDRAGERFCYQLVDGPEGLQIAVLTLLG